MLKQSFYYTYEGLYLYIKQVFVIISEIRLFLQLSYRTTIRHTINL